MNYAILNKLLQKIKIGSRERGREGGERESECDWLRWWGNKRSYEQIAATTLLFFV